MQRLIDIEKEFDKLVPTIGGRRVTEILGTPPDAPNNADYLFDHVEIIAELKCLQENKLEDTELNHNLWALFKTWRKEGYKIAVSEEGWRATLHNLPQHCAQKILELYAKSIRKRVLKANKQIKQTRKILGRPNHKGLLLLANDGNLALEPEHIYHILSYVMKNDFSGINSVAFFTVNMPGKASFTNVDTLLWANLHRPGREQIDDAFLAMLSRSWIEHVSKLLGTLIPTIKLGSTDQLSGIGNSGKSISTET
jgi:hypothetical protein